MESDPEALKSFEQFETSRADAERWLAERDLTGMTEAELRELAGRATIGVRVIVRDGEGLFATADLRPARINVELRNGRVSRVDGIY